MDARFPSNATSEVIQDAAGMKLLPVVQLIENNSQRSLRSYESQLVTCEHLFKDSKGVNRYRGGVRAPGRVSTPEYRMPGRIFGASRIFGNSVSRLPRSIIVAEWG